MQETFQFLAKQNGNKLEVNIEQPIPELLYGDSGKLKQVLLNLTNNAVKFTKDGAISINLKQITDADKILLEFSVEDSGIGIPEDKISELFDAFSQVDNSLSRSYDGSGLGLAISQQLVKIMGGEISVKSAINRGTLFKFCLAFSLEKIVTEHKSTEITTTPPLSILLVEDELVSQVVAKGF